MIMMMTTIIAKRMLMIMMEITTTELRVHRIAQKSSTTEDLIGRQSNYILQNSYWIRPIVNRDLMPYSFFFLIDFKEDTE